MQKFVNKIIFSLYLLSPIAVLAQVIDKDDASIPTGPEINPVPNVTSPVDFLAIIQNVLGWAFAFALILGVAMLIVAGIMYITSAGSARSKTAVQIMIAAIIGIAIAGFAWAIVNVIQGLFFEETRNVTGFD